MDRWRLLLPRADWYFARSFLIIFTLCLTGAGVLVTVGDLSMRTDSFTTYAERGSTMGGAFYMILRYYAAYTPTLILTTMLPILLVFSGVITVTAAGLANEYTVLRASGISARRALAPVIAAAFGVALLFSVTRDYFLPGLIRETRKLSDEIRARPSMWPFLLTRVDGGQRQTAYVGHFDLNGHAYNFSLELRDEARFLAGGAGADDFERHTAWRADLSPRVNLDRPDDPRGYEWRPLPPTAMKQTFTWAYRTEDPAWVDPIPTYMTPAMFERITLGDEILTWADLQAIGAADPAAELEKNARRAEPWAGLLVTLLGAGVALRTMLRRGSGSYVQNILYAMIVTGVFLALRESGRMAWEAGWIAAPATAVWAPLALAGLAATWLVVNMEY